MNAMLLVKDLVDMVLENNPDTWGVCNTHVCFKIKNRHYFTYDIDWETGFVPDEGVIVVELK